ncbi:MAG: sulfate adenylyltransferase [Sulfuricurvum sp. GWF2_44_89]|uniref:Sulfate adenylyltransferase n=1 Tax=Sulfuricurvum kujiense TaxID=148813 RepID=A0A2D3WKD2_9BACT|nr:MULTISPECIES: sulfate adenylyltransferase [Sulfuricurvum]OHD77924.1 MAG: sulfate adenylyltransferase [Sulfuricurvum sp. GWF2_44_89]OHD91314.1 MAG: sulfate adenylyltransferase [Sulfuricurvum sp. RIFOXYD12_FULL_44_77]OHD93000.1 MAG: sulfate adenylyltransferase [Sulfuricurvum sp. RIFOXYD2_FULL_44_160]DAB38184.1 MAG TPA: sulfate adenylyltransferase [Sulfuricurvum kujiense]
MASSRKNRALYIDQEAVSALTLLKSGMLSPVTALMNEKQSKEVLSSGMFLGKTFPFPLILSPSGKVNETILTSAHQGEILDLVCENVVIGELCVDEVYPIDPRERLHQIYGTEDLSHPGVSATHKRLGKYAICGDYSIDLSSVQEIQAMITQAKEQIGAQRTTALFMAANPLHRAHERLIRQSLDHSDLIIIFLLKPYNNADLKYDLRLETLKFFVDNYLPRNRVIIVPLESSYIFAGSNEVILDAIVAKNYGCDRLMIGQNHAGIGMYYDHNANKSIIDRLVGIDIEVGIASEYVYCNQCKTLVSVQTCPHGHHHHISYHSESILELMRQGLLPPAVLVRKEISSMIVASLYPNRFKNLAKLYYDIMPVNGLLEEHSEKDFYIALMRLYQTTSLT